MTLESLVVTFIANLGVTPSQLLGILTSLGCIIIMAKDFRMGIMFLLLFSAVEFIILYSLNQDTQLHLIMMLSSFAIMAISYLITYKKTQSPFEVI